MKPGSMLFRFALAVGIRDKDALLITPENENAGFQSFEAAAQLDQAFCVQVKPGMIAGDFDTEAGVQLALDMAAKLESSGLYPVVTRSGGRGDRAHLFVRAQDPNLAQRVREAIARANSDLGVTGKIEDRSNTRIRPPQSRHRDGKARSELVYPINPEAALSRLEGRSIPTWTPSPKFVELRDSTPEIGTRSDVLWTLVCEAVNSGATISEYLAIDPERFPGFAKLHGRRDAQKRLRAEFLKALATRYHSSRKIVEAEIDQWERLALLDVKANLRKTIRAIADIARKAVKTTVALACRDLSINAGISIGTAQRHLNKLQASGLIEKDTPHGIDHAQLLARTYRLTKQPVKRELLGHSESLPPLSKREVITSVYQNFAFHDAFSGCPVLREVYVCLGDHPLSVAEIACMLRMKLDSVRNHLRRLLECGLARRSSIRTYLRVEVSDLEFTQIAKLRGRDGVAMRREQSIRRSREALAEYLAKGVRPERLFRSAKRPNLLPQPSAMALRAAQAVSSGHLTPMRC